MIDREHWEKMLPIIQAFVNGQTVQYKSGEGAEWIDIEEESYFVGCPVFYRIKPEPKYRPFETKEECWQEMLKHQPFGWAKNIETGDLCNISNIYESAGCAKVFLDTCAYTFSSLLNEFTFIDGTPFGIKEE